MSLVSATPLSSESRVTSSPNLEPLNFKEAGQFLCWYSAMKYEIVVLYDNGTWSLVPFDPIMNVLGCQWVYKIKRRADGGIDCYKARLVAQ
jgi:histone deacetylase 1/2